MPTFIDEAVEVIKDIGSVFTTRRADDTYWRFRIVGGAGVLQWGDGKDTSTGVLGVVVSDYGRTFIEVNPMAGQCVSLSLNSGGVVGDCISLTAEKGELVIRNETKSYDHVMAVISSEGITFPQTEARTAKPADRFYQSPNWCA